MRDPDPGMSVIVQTVTRLLKGFILLYGIFIVLYGHLTPGGGFAGGVVIACGFVLLALAGGGQQAQQFLPRAATSVLDSVGVLLFLALAATGMLLAGGVFFTNFITTSQSSWFTLFSGGVIPLANISLGLKVASSLFLVFAALAAFRVLTDVRDRDGQD